MNINFVPILETNNNVQEQIRQLRNMENVRKYMYSDHIIFEEEHRKWLDFLRDNKNYHVNVIMLDKEPIGIVSLSNINMVHLTADWAFYIREDLQGKGVGSIVEYKLIEMAFNIVGLEKLNCEVLETNPAVIKLHEKFGFSKEGIRRKNIIKNGQRIDVYLLGLLKDEWLNVKPQLQKLIDRLSR